MEEGLCICGKLLVRGDLLVLNCCFRRMHVECMVLWADELRKVHSDINKHEGKEAWRHRDAENDYHHRCDCGEATPYQYMRTKIDFSNRVLDH